MIPWLSTFVQTAGMVLLDGWEDVPTAESLTHLNASKEAWTLKTRA